MSFTSKISKILFVSSFSGLGFSFGRDIYKNAKNNLLLVVFLVILFLAFLGGYTSSVWFFRNQKNIFTSLIYKLGSFILFTISLISYSLCLVVILFCFSILSEYINRNDNKVSETSLNETPSQNNTNNKFIYNNIRNLVNRNNNLKSYWISFNNHSKDLATAAKSYVFLIDSLFSEKKFYPFTFIVLLGCFVGIKQRLERSRAWKSEHNNIAFLKDNHLKSGNDLILVDDDCQEYKLKEVYSDFIEFMPVGKRGKRAYLKINNHGEFTSWSGMIQEDQRGTFLHAK